jgi:DNA-directed RNA polymerase specialized sigma24 family protein
MTAAAVRGWRTIPEGPTVWAGCLRRVGGWRVPPHWSSHDWLEEMQAQGAAAAWGALGDFDPGRGVPWGAFARQRVLSSLRTRHRQEWSYAVHCGRIISAGSRVDPPDPPRASGPSVETLRPRLARLADVDRRLLERLYWEGCTEADLAAELGIAQSTVNKRKRSILLGLRRTMGDSAELL